jgi:predicted dehydrogenase
MCADSPIRLVLVGAGLRGRVWLQAVADSPDTELVGLVDLDPAVARRAADAVGFDTIPCARSLTEMLDQVDPDAVLDATVPAARHFVSSEALLAGLPVLCEKPLATSVSAGLSMIAAAELGGQLLMVAQSRRYFRTLTAFRRQVAAIGPVGLIECTFFRGPRFGGFRDHMPYPLLIDMAIHHFDLARDLTGCDPVSGYCESYNPAWSWYAGDAAARASFEMTDGSRFGFTGSWCSPGLETSWNGSWRVSGAAGTATWDGDNAPVAAAADGSEIVAAPGDGPEDLAGALAEFVAAVHSRTIPSGEAHSNVLSLAMVEAAIRSAQLTRPVTIAETLDDAYAAALQAEQRAEVLEVLERWTSVQDVVGAASCRVPGRQLSGETPS